MPPHYRNFHLIGFEKGTVKPVDFREWRLLRWCPYFFGAEIKLEIKIKPNPSNIYARQISELNYEWRLLEVDSGKTEDGKNDTLISSLLDKDILFAFITLPRRIPLAHHMLEIQFKLGDTILGDWQQIFDFELHSGDKMLFGIVIPIATFLIGILLLYAIQKIFGLPI